MGQKTISAREAAIAVLNRAREMYRLSPLSKAEKPFPTAKDNAANPDAKADAALGEKVEQDVQQHEQNNADPKHSEPMMKGHIKLAKFVGRMEHKKGEKAKSMQKMDPQDQMAGGMAPPPATPADPGMTKSESDFDKLKNKIKEKEGYSEKAAAATAAKIGREKLGEAEMARRSAAGRKK